MEAPQMRTLLAIVVILSLSCLLGCSSSQGQAAEKKDLPVPHWHQVFGLPDWSNGETFISPVSGETKSILYAACWPAALVDCLAYYKVIERDQATVAAETRRAYDGFANFDDGAHTSLIPDYVSRNWPPLRVAILDVSDLGKWPAEKKWRLLKECIEQDQPVMATVRWVRARGKIFPHAIVIRGYEDDGQRKIAILNDPSGGEFLTGIWDEKITGEAMKVNYCDFFDTRFVVVVREASLLKLTALFDRYAAEP